MLLGKAGVLLAPLQKLVKTRDVASAAVSQQHVDLQSLIDCPERNTQTSRNTQSQTCSSLVSLQTWSSLAVQRQEPHDLGVICLGVISPQRTALPLLPEARHHASATALH